MRTSASWTIIPIDRYCDLPVRNTSEEVVRVYGQTAVVTGKSHMKFESGELEYDLLIPFIDVYVKSNRNWQMVAWQSTKL